MTKPQEPEPLFISQEAARELLKFAKGRMEDWRNWVVDYLNPKCDPEYVELGLLIAKAEGRA